MIFLKINCKTYSKNCHHLKDTCTIGFRVILRPFIPNLNTYLTHLATGTDHRTNALMVTISIMHLRKCSSLEEPLNIAMLSYVFLIDGIFVPDTTHIQRSLPFTSGGDGFLRQTDERPSEFCLYH